MPFVLIVAGLILVISAARNTVTGPDGLFTLLQGDFTGEDNFIYWFLSLMVIGAIGYIPKMKPFSDGFLILVIIQLFLKKDTGFFDQFKSQLDSSESYTGSSTGGIVGSIIGGVVSNTPGLSTARTGNQAL